MKSGKNRVLFFASALLLFLLAQLLPQVSAAGAGGFVFSLEESRADAGESVLLRLALSREAAVAGFRASVSFDAEKTEFAGMDFSDVLGGDSVQGNPDGNPVAAVYVCGTQLGKAPELSGTLITFRFRVRDGAEGSAAFQGRIDQTCDYDGKDLAMDTETALSLTVGSPPQSGAGEDSSRGQLSASSAARSAASSAARNGTSSGKQTSSAAGKAGSSAPTGASSAGRKPDAAASGTEPSGTASGTASSEREPIILVGNDASAQLSAVLIVCLAACAAVIVCLLAARKRKQ